MIADVTPWFNGTDVPWEPGVYEREYNSPAGGPWYAEWTGSQWLSPARSVHAASKQVTVAFNQGPLRWRGLAKDPKS